MEFVGLDLGACFSKGAHFRLFKFGKSKGMPNTVVGVRNFDTYSF